MSPITQILEFLKDRIKRNMLTTVLGIFIIVASVASHFVMGTSWTEVLIGVCVGIILLPMKDPKKPKGAAALIILLLLLSACKSTKSTSSSERTVVKNTDSVTREMLQSLQTIEYFDDEISGFIPVRLQDIPEYDSLIVPIKSKGVDMELIVKRTGITYNTKVKPVARSSLQKHEVRETDTKQMVRETQTTETKEVQKPSGIRLPWWLWLIIILACLFAVLRLLKVISNPLKLF